MVVEAIGISQVAKIRISFYDFRVAVSRSFPCSVSYIMTVTVFILRVCEMRRDQESGGIPFLPSFPPLPSFPFS